MIDTVLKAALRSDLKAFIEKSFETVSGNEKFQDNWHIDAVVHELMRCYSGDTKRLIITQPPRSLKSISSSVALVAWALGQDPTLRIICVSYSKELSLLLARQCRRVMENDWYAQVFPKTRLAKTTEAELVTTAGGGRVATSVDGTLTGRGADIIIIDDPLNATDAQSEAQRAKVIDWYRGTLSTRLNNKKTGRIILVMQRLHEDDLAGHLIEQGGFNHLNLPVEAVEDEVIEIGAGRFHRRRAGDLLHPDREGKTELAQARRSLGSLGFSAQYMQQPLPTEGNLVKRHWFATYDDPPTPKHFRIVQSWDLASSTKPTADYSACVTAIKVGNKVYVIDVWRGRKLFPDLRKKIISHARIFRATDILIEKASAGESMLQELREKSIEGVPKPVGIKPDGDKATRLVAVSAFIERGDVYLPAQADWLAPFLNELLGFPNAKHDDCVDAFSQLLNWVRKRSGQSAPQAYLPSLRPSLYVDGVEYAPPASEGSMSSLFGGVVE